MGLRICTNIASLDAQRNWARVTQSLQGNYRRLSTGLRIATAADDPAGLAMSERLRAQIRSLAQAESNANDAVSFVQTGEGALDAVSSLRGAFGAIQNRLEYTLANLGTTREDLAAAESRIRDVDVAYETAQPARNILLQKAARTVWARSRLHSTWFVAALSQSSSTATTRRDRSQSASRVWVAANPSFFGPTGKRRANTGLVRSPACTCRLL